VKRSDIEPPLVLVVEDDEAMRASIVRSLQVGGFRTRDCLRREDILAQLAEGSCAAIVLDLGLPGDDGIRIAAEIRTTSNIPILMLTGRAGIRERVIGLEAGADDYLVKPYAREELIARMRAILRRYPKDDERDPRVPYVAARIGDAHLLLSTCMLSGPLGEQRLTERETRLLMALCRSDGPLSRLTAYRVLFQREWDALDRSLDVHISNLRRKLQSVSAQPGIVATVRGEGYELRVPCSIETSDPDSPARVLA